MPAELNPRPGDTDKLSEFKRRKLAAAAPTQSLLKENRYLYQTLVAPLIAALPEHIEHVAIDPDSILHAVPFAALFVGRAEGAPEFFGDRYEISYVSSPRDLLRGNIEPPREATPPVIVGNPVFGRSETDGLLASNTITTGHKSFRSLSEPIAPLRSAERECQSLAKLYAERGIDARLLLGTEASEDRLFTLRDPSALHFSTHACFLPDRKFGSRGDPMEDSMLFLSGAESTRRRLHSEDGTFPLPNDGIVTAAEATNLNLTETRLVSMSACSTALGITQNCDGVLGLKRALLVAGAQNLALTLWHIPDSDETVGFFTDFYRHYLTGKSPREALALTQRVRLHSLLASHGIWHAVRGAGAYVLTSCEPL